MFKRLNILLSSKDNSINSLQYIQNDFFPHIIMIPARMVPSSPALT